MTRKEKNDEINYLLSEVNSAKSELIRLEYRMAELNGGLAKKLGKIIWKLEVWQNVNKR